MYQETLELITATAVQKTRLCTSNLKAFLVHSAMAGVYLGFAVVLVFVLTTPYFHEHSPATSFIMAATFGLAFSLVLAAGADLFTGNTLIMMVGTLKKSTTWGDFFKVCFWSYFGNLLGAFLLAILAWQAVVLADTSWLLTVAERKMQAPWLSLFFRGILCNWLVVLALWCSYRLKSDTAKLLMVWWCLLGFVGSGYEHSIANMSLLILAYLAPSDGVHLVSWGGMVHNLIPVTLGNIVSGTLFMGIPYYYVSYSK